MATSSKTTAATEKPAAKKAAASKKVAEKSSDQPEVKKVADKVGAKAPAEKKSPAKPVVKKAAAKNHKNDGMGIKEPQLEKQDYFKMVEKLQKKSIFFPRKRRFFLLYRKGSLSGALFLTFYPGYSAVVSIVVELWFLTVVADPLNSLRRAAIRAWSIG